MRGAVEDSEPYESQTLRMTDSEVQSQRDYGECRLGAIYIVMCRTEMGTDSNFCYSENYQILSILTEGGSAEPVSMVGPLIQLDEGKHCIPYAGLSSSRLLDRQAGGEDGGGACG